MIFIHPYDVSRVFIEHGRIDEQVSVDLNVVTNEKLDVVKLEWFNVGSGFILDQVG